MDYTVIGSTANPEINFANCRIIKSSEAIPAGFKPLLEAAPIDDCLAYITAAQGNDSGKWVFPYLTIAQYGLIFLVTGVFVYVLINSMPGLAAGATGKDQNDSARNLITFLVAVATIGIAFLAILTAMVIRDFEKRFMMAKEVLTVLVGILGTIIGFYFGQVSNTQAGAPNPNTNTSVNRSVNGIPAPTNSNPNSNSNSNANAKANANKPANINADSGNS